MQELREFIDSRGNRETLSTSKSNGGTVGGWKVGRKWSYRARDCRSRGAYASQIVKAPVY